MCLVSTNFLIEPFFLGRVLKSLQEFFHTIEDNSEEHEGHEVVLILHVLHVLMVKNGLFLTIAQTELLVK